MKIITIATLDRTKHDVHNFDCGNSALNNWLSTISGQHQNRSLSNTYTLTQEAVPHKICGYYALAIRQMVQPQTLPPLLAKKLPTNVPAYTLARLAVDVSFQKMKYGERLLVDAMQRAKLVSAHVGGPFLFVDAKDQDGAGFYCKYGFTALPNAPLTLVIPISTIP